MTDSRVDMVGRDNALHELEAPLQWAVGGPLHGDFGAEPSPLTV
jgi:hypothetical protein